MIEEIEKGWSSDKKYYIQTNDHQEFLMRTSALDSIESKKIEFEKIQEIYSLAIPISEPIDLDIHNNSVHSLFTWIEGNEARDVLPSLSVSKQYDLGFQAGEFFKKIHHLPAPKNMEPWGSSFERKIDRNIHNYQSCELKYENGNVFLKYIENNRHLIQNRPLVFQHGDYHTGNMILSSTNKLSIIDFNRWSYGDPWEEFNRIDFSAQISPAFAAGQIDGYFSSKPPIEFFNLMALYISVNALNALPWATSYSQNDVVTAKQKAASILEWYDGMERVIPKWYLKYSSIKTGKAR
ncbi:aminoglycoside phosphotransferase family protein [Desemzia incerta]|uniref:aminoglycoside phosphotransferase family protein n=1 Tax=Desemzia incerta TaxID=82801 RepID=UPI00166069DC|nr:phosphotransferase [Desemzia incerta]